jgi:hypothetical protein
MTPLALALALLLAAPAAAQDTLTIIPPTRGTVDPEAAAPEGGDDWSGIPLGATGEVAAGRAGVLRVLDKLDGSFTDLDLAPGSEGRVGALAVVMGECRYPADNPAGDAYALVSIRTVADDTAVFEGWLIASAPALNAMDHPRYDVWALRCEP